MCLEDLDTWEEEGGRIGRYCILEVTTVRSQIVPSTGAISIEGKESLLAIIHSWINSTPELQST